LVSSTTTPPPLPSNTKHIFNIDLRQNDQRQPELLLQTTTANGTWERDKRMQEVVIKTLRLMEHVEFMEFFVDWRI
jgi:hypothetical protein